MKIAFTTREAGMDAPMDDRFGRAPYFVMVDTETGAAESEENPNVSAGSGAGIGSAEFLSRRGVGAVITGNLGPKASRALMAAGIGAYRASKPTVRENVDAYSRKELNSLSDPTVDEKSGMGRGMGRGRGRRRPL